MRLSLAPEIVIAEHLAVVAAEDDERVVPLAAPLEILQEMPSQRSMFSIMAE